MKSLLLQKWEGLIYQEWIKPYVLSRKKFKDGTFITEEGTVLISDDWCFQDC